jgi:phospholipid/cholesterol/gamma-HCH transport system substrate-binding protein
VSNQAKVGVFSIITLAILIFGFYFLKGVNLFTTKNKYYASYNQVDGLYKSNPMVVNGFRIGSVSNMVIDPKTGKVVVEMTAEDDFQIPDKSTAVIVSTDLTGSKVVSVQLVPSATFFKNGDTIPTGFKADMTTTIGNAVDDIKPKLIQTLANLDSVLKGASFAFDAKNPNGSIYKLNIVLSNVDDITAKDGSLKKTLANLQSITDNVAKNNAKIQNILVNFSSLSDSLKQANLKQTIENASAALAELKKTIHQINNGDGTIGKLINEKGIYNNIDSTITSMHSLLDDVKAHPYRYVNVSVFGGQKRDEKYKAKLAKEAASKPKK